MRGPVLEYFKGPYQLHHFFMKPRKSTIRDWLSGNPERNSGPAECRAAFQPADIYPGMLWSHREDHRNVGAAGN